MPKLSFQEIIEIAEKKLVNAAKFNFRIEGLNRIKNSIYQANTIAGKNLFITPSVPKLVETKYGKRYCFQISGCETKIWMPLQNVMVVGLDNPESKVFLIHCTDKQMNIFAKAKNNPIDWTTKITQDNINRLFFDRRNALKIPLVDKYPEELKKEEKDDKNLISLNTFKSMHQNKIDFNQIEEIKNKADIVSIIGKYIKLSRRGANYFGVCPFHADHNPSLVVSPSKKIWKCFVCGSKGNVFTFIQKYKKISFLEAVKEVATIEGYDLNKLSFLNNSHSFLNPENKRLVEANAYTNDLYKSFLMDNANKEYLDYLTNHRHLSLDTIKYFEFGYAPTEEDLIYKILTNKDNFLGSSRDATITWNEKELCDAGIIYLNENQKPIDFLINRITIPIYDNNNHIVGFSGRTTKNNSPKYLNTGSTKIFSKGSLLFNFNKVKELNDKRIIIVEGFMDAIALHNCDHRNVVATMGVSLTDKHLTLLNSLELDTVILCFDNDAAGELATIENGRKLMSNGFNVYVVNGYDKKIKDVDELMQSQGKQAVDSIINNKIDFISFLIKLKLSNKKSLDDIQTNVNSILKEINEYGDVLLRTKHFKLIAELSGIHLNDIQSKFNENNNLYKSQFIRNYKYQKKSNTIHFDNLKTLLKDQAKKNENYLSDLEYKKKQEQLVRKKISKDLQKATGMEM